MTRNLSHTKPSGLTPYPFIHPHTHRSKNQGHGLRARYAQKSKGEQIVRARMPG